MPFTRRTVTADIVKGIRELDLVAGDTIEIRKNGNVVESFTVPQGKTLKGQIGIQAQLL